MTSSWRFLQTVVLRVSSPFTAAGPRGHFTLFPYPSGTMWMHNRRETQNLSSSHCINPHSSHRSSIEHLPAIKTCQLRLSVLVKLW